MDRDMVNVGIIGTGVGIRTLLPGFRNTGRATVTSIVGRTPERGAEFAQKYNIAKSYASYKNLVDDPTVDLVCVASPNIEHFEAAMYALKCGKHVLIEKPLALSM